MSMFSDTPRENLTLSEADLAACRPLVDEGGRVARAGSRGGRDAPRGTPGARGAGRGPHDRSRTDSESMSIASPCSTICPVTCMH